MADERLRALFPRAADCVPSLVASPWWVGHIPFAFELVSRLRPRVVVELGTYTGTSLAAFCRAAELCDLDAQCFGIDLWTGDPHMGQFTDDIYATAAAALATRHPQHAVLIRSEFGDAAAHFTDESIDLLHIDGTHTYEAVSRDFEVWLPKLSSRGVVLLHDTHVTEKNLGPSAVQYEVGRFFDEIRPRYPHIAFEHSYGLGVLLVGDEAPAAVRELVAVANRRDGLEYFAACGAALAEAFVVEPRTPAGWRRRLARVWIRLMAGQRSTRMPAGGR